MSEERDQRLAQLFESNTVELSADEFAARVRHRIKRESTIARVRKAVLLLALLVVGVLFSDQMNNALIEAQASIEQALERYVWNYQTIGKVAVAVLVVGFVVRRRIRRWV
jgi:hypothetical protein